MKKLIAALIVMALAMPAVVRAEGGHNHGAVKANHGGKIIELSGEVAHLEYVHDAAVGKITIYVLDGAAKNALSITGVIRVNLSGKNRVQVVAQPVNLKDGKASIFSVIHVALKKSHLNGRLSLKIKDKKYNAEIPHAHGDHAKHKGHKH
jgi:hypothetical protein